MKKWFVLTMLFLLLSGCMAGPDYVRPKTIFPKKYKEAPPPGWKMAEPKDRCQRGEWWKIFHDERLNQMEAQLNITNQNIIQAVANYEQSLALIREAKAPFFPTLAALVDITRQKQGSGSASFISTSGTSVSSGQVATGATSGTGKTTTFHTTTLNAAWELDLWGAIRRNVESARDTAQANFANIEVARLSAQASLAQFYFQLRALDRDQKILDDTVKEYRKVLKYTRNRYQSGVDSESDIVQAQSQLESAEASAIANGIARQQTEHAIAVLIGMPPADFSIPFSPLGMKGPPAIPLEVPSALLERRPDIAAAERLMAAANAQIGVAVAAYFPTITLSGDGSYTHQGWASWLSLKNASWSLTSEFAETILDGGLRQATVDAAKATFASNVAAYKETVLTAFQNVEDNLVSLRILKQQWVMENKAYLSAKKALQIVINQYNAGTTDFNSVTIAETNSYTAERLAADIIGQEMVAAVLLIKDLGGGWDVCPTCCAAV